MQSLKQSYLNFYLNSWKEGSYLFKFLVQCSGRRSSSFIRSSFQMKTIVSLFFGLIWSIISRHTPHGANISPPSWTAINFLISLSPSLSISAIADCSAQNPTAHFPCKLMPENIFPFPDSRAHATLHSSNTLIRRTFLFASLWASL